MDFLDDINKNNIDTDVDNYTVTELLIILDIDSPDQEEIIQKTNNYIEKFEDEGNEEMVEAIEIQKSIRKKQCCILMVILVVIGAIVGIIIAVYKAKGGQLK